MRVRVRLYAVYRERLGREALDLDLPEGAPAGAVLDALQGLDPSLAPLLPITRLARGVEYVPLDHPLREGDEVVVVPPVSGGEGPWVLLTREPLDPAPLEAAVRSPAHGATVTFLGTVRDRHQGRRVLFLEYEAYEPMALHRLEAIARAAEERFGVRVAVAHRLGRLEVGELALAVAVGAPHRGPAFDACRYVVERLKEEVPIWKKEHFEGGAVWVGSERAGVLLEEGKAPTLPERR